MIRLTLVLGALLALGGCAEPVLAPLEEVQRRAYVSEGPAELTLYTVINNRSENGAHTALLIDGSQRVIWDPAGSFYHPHAPERNDLLYGFSPQIQAVYEDYHARETFRIVKQSVRVSPEVAEMALRLAQEQGPASDATCSLTTSGILRKLPGFESMPSSWYPKSTMAAFARLTGDQGVTIRDNDADSNHGVLIRATRQAGPAELPPQLQPSR